MNLLEAGEDAGKPTNLVTKQLSPHPDERQPWGALCCPREPRPALGSSVLGSSGPSQASRGHQLPPPTGQSPSWEGPIVPLPWVPPAQAARCTHLARAAATSAARPQRPCVAGPGAQELLPSASHPRLPHLKPCPAGRSAGLTYFLGTVLRDISGVRASPQERGPSLHGKPRQAHVGRGCPGRLESRLSRPHVPTCWTQMTRTERRVLSQETKSEATSRGSSAPGTPGTPMDSGPQATGPHVSGRSAAHGVLDTAIGQGHRTLCLLPRRQG